MSDRARYRDFFDVYLILKNYKIDLQEIIGYIRQKEIRNPITKAKILQNWGITRAQKELEVKVIFYSQHIEDLLIEEMIQRLPFDECLI